jgi:hypothetical protein
VLLRLESCLQMRTGVWDRLSRSIVGRERRGASTVTNEPNAADGDEDEDDGGDDDDDDEDDGACACFLGLNASANSAAACPPCANPNKCSASLGHLHSPHKYSPTSLTSLAVVSLGSGFSIGSPSEPNESHHWYACSSSSGTREGARRARMAVWGSFRDLPRLWNGSWVSPVFLHSAITVFKVMFNLELIGMNLLYRVHGRGRGGSNRRRRAKECTKMQTKTALLAAWTDLELASL